MYRISNRFVFALRLYRQVGGPLDHLDENFNGDKRN